MVDLQLSFVLACGHACCSPLEQSKAWLPDAVSKLASPSLPEPFGKNAHAWALTPNPQHLCPGLGPRHLCVVTDLRISGATSKAGCIAAAPAFQMQHLPA